MKPSSSPGAGLSALERELLARARQQLAEDSVPSAVRERLLGRARAELQQTLDARPRPLQLVPVRSRGAVRALGAAVAMAAALVLLAQPRARGPAGTGDETLARDESGAASPERRIGARLFQSELFHEPAAAYVGPVPAPSASLFGEQPFSPHSHAWQARRWNDLGVAPTELAAYEHEADALCLLLSSGERVVAGWPWLPASSEAAQRARAERTGEPAAVALEAGRHYRLLFKAWAREPLPEQLLIAVGHSRVPFSGAGGARVEVSSEPRWFEVEIVPRHDDPSVGVALLANAGSGSAPTRVCVSDVTLTLGGSR